MTILFYAPIEVFHRPTGAGTYVGRLLKALLRIDQCNRYIIWHGCMVKVPLLYRPFQPPLDIADRVVVRFTKFPTRLFHHHRTRAFLWRFSFLPLADILFRHPHVCFSPFYPFLPYRRPAFVLTIFDLTPLTLPHCHLPSTIHVGRLTLLWAKRANRLLTFSQAVKEQLVSWLGFEAECIVVTPLAADERFRPQSSERVEAVREKYGIDKPYILFAGTIEPRKNLVTLLRAFAPLTKDFPHLLVLAGARGWFSEPVFAEVERLGLKERIAFTEYVPEEDLPALMSGADVFVYPSLGEGFGLPPLEAMACGTPVICSNAPALPEVVGEDAITVLPTEVEAWTEAMRQVLSDADLRAKLREKGLKRAQKFSWERTAQLTLKAFEEAAFKVWRHLPTAK